MKRSNRLILLIGVFLAIVAFVGIVIIFQGNRSGGDVGTPAAPQELPTVFATRDIALGTPVTADMLEVKTQPLTERDATAFGSDSLLLGQIARRNIVAGKQLTQDDFDVTGAPLTIDTPAGLRAFAMQVDQVSGVGTLIRTGDYVDVIAGFQTWPLVTIDPATGNLVAGPATNPTSTKLVLQGMQVLGTLLPPPPAAAEGAEGAEGDGAQGGTALTGQQEILILGVTPQQAEVLKYAQLDGNMTVVLRSPADFRDPDTQEPLLPEPATTTGITLRTLVDEYDVLIPQVIEAVLPDDEQPAGGEDATP